MATAKPRARKPKAVTASALLEALKFVQVAQHTEGTPMQTHCRFSNGQLIAFNGALAVGHLIEEQLNACPHTATLIAALSKCQDAISITQLDSGKLAVKSGKFRATVPCVGLDDLPGIEPDPPIATLSDTLKRALTACLPLTSDGLPEAFLCGVLVQSGTAMSTNRAVAIEAFHGIDLPRFLLPKSSAAAIAKSSKPLVKFGYSGNSATFWFEDNSFIRTMLFEDKFPSLGKILDVESHPFPVPAGFYEAIETVLPFCKDAKVYFIDDKVCSSGNAIEGTTYEVPGLTNGLAFNGEYLRMIRPYAHSMHFSVTPNGASYFFDSENLTRGAIMPMRVIDPNEYDKPIPF